MKNSTRKTLDNVTAFAVIEMGEYEIRQYWTGSKGVYGDQVLTVIFAYPEFHEYKSAGCGYCKRTDGLEWAFRTIGKAPKGYKEGGDLPRDIFIGGNFHRVPNSKIRNYK